MEPKELKPGEIVQLVPSKTKNKAFAGCLMIVSEPKQFGAQGYVQGLGTREEFGGQAYYRAGWEEMETTGGNAVFVPAHWSEDKQ